MVRRVGRHVGGGSGEPAEDASLAAVRDVYARWASGVALVALRNDDDVHALTVSAFMPLSLRPPLVCIGLGANAAVLPFLDPGVAFGVSLLAAEQAGMASRFADSFPVGRSPFQDGDPPVVADGLAALECECEELRPVGDHHLLVGRVIRARPLGAGSPLIYHDRDYHQLADGNE